MEIILTIILVILGYSLIEKYQYKVGGWWVAFFIYMGIAVAIFILIDLLQI